MRSCRGAHPVEGEPDQTGPAVDGIVGRLAAERREVATKWGVRDIPPDDAWLASSAASAPPGAVGSVARRHVLERTAGSLVPLVSAARMVDVATPTTDAVIELVAALLEFDVSAAGRRIEAIGLGRADLDQIRRAVSTPPRST